MTAATTLRALESNRLFTDLKDAEARLSQASRDLKAGVISEEEYNTEAELCIKIIRACSLLH
ncbi:hypothetical protein [Thalassolituus sp.]|uniref:hypothetical protein n=1 Tax=Thalassolituus sp. TaxID=2030822 RepID=UPI002A7FD59F|nr:hypothetical protein [Thalassolituus sp.]